MTATTPKLRWAYMDHWRIDTPQGQLSQYTSVKRFDAFLKQISAIGYEAIETFDFHLGPLRELFGSLENARAFMQERGIDKVLSLFHAVMYDERQSAPHVRATHDHIFNYAQHIMRSSVGLGVENFIVMPAGLYYDVEPVTDDKLKACAELWNRVGKMTLEYGVKTCCHHEFFCGIRSAEQLRKFYEYTDPRYVFFYCDTAQHVIAGVDPVDLYLKLHDRCGGFHMKDTHHVDLTGDYRRRPDAEVMAPTTPRWFHEMGTPEGLVDFPALLAAMKECGYEGWVGVEHDKADVGGGNYPESTALSAWYIQHVLKKIYA
ncbi:sugar phosphate isomerase/epimerase family protein [Pseudoduganella namucuonensis]|uniref:Sugar phosphate isomerase/epimerase n=1 Tax=Pseudoduganella namucuonensis TaxID=1035707 RepID=A0A1I7H0W4_9BURK|nr:TIM barrel protein [Pseudoduganella namucuonensis]SFU54361.1 Sugar phosphate isomerase/epimerase [Pseudoduganella namucuonensis]